MQTDMVSPVCINFMHTVFDQVLCDSMLYPCYTLHSIRHQFSLISCSAQSNDTEPDLWLHEAVHGLLLFSFDWS
jgi:hypothetical protein